MKDDRARLIDSLNELKAVLAASSSLDETNRGRLEHAIGEIEGAISGDLPSMLDDPVTPDLNTDIADGHSTLSSRLSEATFEFEASHPRLSGALGGVVDALSRMGI